MTDNRTRPATDAYREGWERIFGFGPWRKNLEKRDADPEQSDRIEPTLGPQRLTEEAYRAMHPELRR